MNGDDQQFEETPVQLPDGSIIPVRHPKFERLPTGAFKPEDQRQLFAFAKKQYDLAHPPPAPVTSSSASPDPIDLTAAAANVDPEETLKGFPSGIARGLANVPALIGEMGRAEIESAAAPFTDKTDLPPSLTVEQIAQPIRSGISKATGGYIPEDRPTTPSGQAGERMGEFFGDPVSWIGPGGPIVKGLGALTGGLGSFIGEQVGGTPGAFIGGAAGGAITGLASPRALPKRPPAAVRAATTEQGVKSASQSAYGEMDALQFTLPTLQARQLQDAIAKQMIQEGYRPYQGSAPGAFKTIEEISTPYAMPGTTRTMSGITVGDLEAVRQSLNRIRASGGTEAMAAGAAIEGIDDYLLNLPNVAGITERARKNWAAYKRGQIVEETIQRALDRAQVTGVGGNTDNAIRQEFLRRIKNKPKIWSSFTKEEQAEIDKIIRPGTVVNLSRYISRFGPRHMLTAAVTGGTLHIAGAPLPMLIALAGAGEVGHQIAKRATHGRAERLSEITRARSPAGGSYEPPPSPGRLLRGGAGAARALGATALSPETTEAIELPEITVTPQ